MAQADSTFLVFTTKILSYVSESNGLTLPWANGSLVSSFPRYVRPRTDSDQILGEFNPGVQIPGTPITAEVVHGGSVAINVIWRDVYGQVVSGSWSKTRGWVTSNRGEQLVDGRN